MSELPLRTMTGAIVAPVTQYVRPGPGQPKGAFDGGLYTARGVRDPFGDNAMITHDNVGPPSLRAQRELPGRWLYAGMIHNAHFGHFTSESLCRLWGADRTDVQGIVFQAFKAGQPLAAGNRALLEALLPGLEICQILAPTQIAHLEVPAAARFPAGFIAGTPETRGFFRARMDAIAAKTQVTAPPDSRTRLFVSRACLKPEHAQACFVLEDWLDNAFATAGFTVIHPELLSLEEQITAYASARDLVFAEGSAFHLYVLNARPEQRVFNLWRRQVKHPVFQRQLEGFAGTELLGEIHVTDMFMRRDRPTERARALSLLDFETLGDDLARHGFIDRAAWPQAPAQAIAADLARRSATFQTERTA